MEDAVKMISKILLLSVVYGSFVDVDGFLWNLVAFILLYFATDYLHFRIMQAIHSPSHAN